MVATSTIGQKTYGDVAPAYPTRPQGRDRLRIGGDVPPQRAALPPEEGARRPSLRSEFAVPIGSRDPAVHEEVAAGDEPTVRAHKQGADGSDFLRGAATSSRRHVDHAPVSFAARAAQLVSGKRGKDDAGTDRVNPRAALAPPYRLGHDPQRISALGDLVGVKGVSHLIRLEHRKGAQIISRGGWGGPSFGGGA